MTNYSGILITFLFSAILTGIMVYAATLFGPKNMTPTKALPYETGKDPFVLPNKVRVSVHFYVIAMIFIIFDVEIAFLFPWAVVFREFGWSGFIGISVFIFFLLLGFLYAWKNRTLDVK